MKINWFAVQNRYRKTIKGKMYYSQQFAEDTEVNRQIAVNEITRKAGIAGIMPTVKLKQDKGFAARYSKLILQYTQYTQNRTDIKEHTRVNIINSIGAFSRLAGGKMHEKADSFNDVCKGYTAGTEQIRKSHFTIMLKWGKLRELITKDEYDKAELILSEKQNKNSNEIEILSIGELKQIFNELKERKSKDLLLCALLCLNCSLAPVDIGALKLEHINFDDNYIEKNREKTGVLGRWWLWESTRELLEAHIAKNKYDDGLVFKTNSGEKIVRFEKNNRYNSIDKKIRRLAKKLDMSFTFYHFRRTGATILAEMFSDDIAAKYLAHASNKHKVAHRHYIKPDSEYAQIDCLQEQLKAVESFLIDNGVL